MAMKRGASLYSFQEKFFLHRLDLEGCVAAAAQAGAKGIELIPEQMCWQEYLHPSDKFAAQWKEWMEKYDVEPVAMDVFFDYALFGNRILTKKEQIAMYENNIEFAVKLGFPIVRAMMCTTLDLLEEMWKVAEYYGVKFGVEVHAPVHITAPYFMNLMERIDKTGTKFGGIIPDISIFAKCPPPVAMRKQIRYGADPDLVAYMLEEYDKGVPQKEVSAVVRQKGAKQIDLETLNFIYRNVKSDPKDILVAGDKIIHVHGKVYEMDDNCEETSLDYENAIKYLKEIGYEGYICTEYEGQRYFHDQGTGDFEDDEIEQVRRHQVQLKKLIGE